MSKQEDNSQVEIVTLNGTYMFEIYTKCEIIISERHIINKNQISTSQAIIFPESKLMEVKKFNQFDIRTENHYPRRSLYCRRSNNGKSISLAIY